MKACYVAQADLELLGSSIQRPLESPIPASPLLPYVQVFSWVALVLGSWGLVYAPSSSEVRCAKSDVYFHV
ncbi:hypothetical protein AAY473_008624 [Plecturocebus cupreus]